MTDYEATIALWNASEGVEVAEGDDRDTIARYLERNPGLSRVALNGNRVVGAVLSGHDGRRGLIYHLAVAADHRGQGIGKKLVEECLAGLRLAGIPRVLILVSKDNVIGGEFWVARGFEPLGGAAAYGIDL